MRRAMMILVVALITMSMAGLVLFYSEDLFSGGGRGYGSGTQNAQDQRSLWLSVFAIPMVVALAVVVYGVLFPEIKVEKQLGSSKKASVMVEKDQTLETVLRVLSADERKVIDALTSSKEGFMLQRDIRWKTGLSRVKTHRVLARLAVRGIVKVEKYYNTNKVVLVDWIARNEKSG